jgi:hypothetical protein
MNTQGIMSDAYRAAWQWAAEHVGELHERYEERWVAIADGQVIAAGPNPRRVEAEARRKTGHLREDIYIRFVESSTAIYGQSLPLL